MFTFKGDPGDLNSIDHSFFPHNSPEPGFIAPTLSRSLEVDSQDDILKYINFILMEENMERKPSLLHDPLALQEIEKSLYDVIGEKYPASPHEPPLYFNPNGEQKPSLQSNPFKYPFETTLKPTSQLLFGSMKSFGDDVNGPMNSSMSSYLFSNKFSDSDSVLQFKRGMVEASKFLPRNNQLIIDFESYVLPPESDERASDVVVNMEDGRENPPNGSRGRKNHLWENSNLEEERKSKQLAVYVDESELSEMFDKVFLYTNRKGEPACYNSDEEAQQTEATKNSQQNGQSHGPSGAKNRAKKQGIKNEVVDLTAFLINCAQSHASPFGDGSQRVAHIFANGLEACLAGTGSQIYAALASKRIAATEQLKAYQLYLSWPILIQHLSTLPGAAPELQITGIELPQPGLQPAELVEETGHWLAKYCERFNVQCQYYAIAQKWETIKRKMNLDIFVHAVINASHDAPFFVSRFREAVLNYSSPFDMLDINMSREAQDRVNLEREFYGREVMKIIACEGLERVERPETYKQWQAHNMRAGFKMLPLKQEMLKKFRGKVKEGGNHEDFVIEEDGQWMLQGWRGRIFCASSCWVPA
ncbi:unnamed protein product [Camellia sinensis]